MLTFHPKNPAYDGFKGHEADQQTTAELLSPEFISLVTTNNSVSCPCALNRTGGHCSGKWTIEATGTTFSDPVRDDVEDNVVVEKIT